jgi:hypothetical protein
MKTLLFKAVSLVAKKPLLNEIQFLLDRVRGGGGGWGAPLVEYSNYSFMPGCLGILLLFGLKISIV